MYPKIHVTYRARASWLVLPHTAKNACARVPACGLLTCCALPPFCYESSDPHPPPSPPPLFYKPLFFFISHRRVVRAAGACFAPRCLPPGVPAAACVRPVSGPRASAAACAREERVCEREREGQKNVVKNRNINPITNHDHDMPVSSRDKAHSRTHHDWMCAGGRAGASLRGSTLLVSSSSFSRCSDLVSQAHASCAIRRATKPVFLSLFLTPFRDKSRITRFHGVACQVLACQM